MVQTLKVKTYEACGGLKHFEEDTYEDGCNPDTGGSSCVDIDFKSDSIGGLLKKIKEYFDVDNDSLLLNSCEEVGRIDIQVLENAEGYKALKSDIECWKDGDKILWSACYSFCVKCVTREEVDLNKKEVV